MNGDDTAAGRTRPSLSFVPDKGYKPIIPDIPKVLDHAHTVAGAVALVQVFQSAAGIPAAGETELLRAGLQFFAVLDAADNAGFCFAGVPAVASGTTVFFSQESDAEAAVHPARRDRLCFDRLNGFFDFHFS